MRSPGRSCRCHGCGSLNAFGGKRPKTRRCYRRWRPAALLDAVRAKVLAAKGPFRKEVLSVELRAKESDVEQALHKLNLEGLVHQPLHLAPHDSTRDPWGGMDSGWMGDTYYRTETSG